MQHCLESDDSCVPKQRGCQEGAGLQNVSVDSGIVFLKQSRIPTNASIGWNIRPRPLLTGKLRMRLRGNLLHTIG